MPPILLFTRLKTKLVEIYLLTPHPRTTHFKLHSVAVRECSVYCSVGASELGVEGKRKFLVFSHPGLFREQISSAPCLLPA